MILVSVLVHAVPILLASGFDSTHHINAPSSCEVQAYLEYHNLPRLILINFNHYADLIWQLMGRIIET